MDEILKMILIESGFSAVIIGLVVGLMQKRFEKMEKAREEKERQQEALQIIILDSLNGCIQLSRASAVAISRIPDARCNGDIRKALSDIDETVQRQQKLITEAGVRGIMHD